MDDTPARGAANSETAQDTIQDTPRGWAALAAPGCGRALMVPLTPELMAGGHGLIQAAQGRATALGDRTAADLLAGNAYLAAALDPPDRTAACLALGALAGLLDSRALLAVVTRDGDVLACTVESLADPTPATLRARAADAAGLAPAKLRPGQIAGVGNAGAAHDDFGTA